MSAEKLFVDVCFFVLMPLVIVVLLPIWFKMVRLVVTGQPIPFKREVIDIKTEPVWYIALSSIYGIAALGTTLLSLVYLALFFTWISK